MHFLRLFWTAAKRWLATDASRLSAALAYFTPFALVPLVVISVSVVGWFTDPRLFATLLQSWGEMLGVGATELIAEAVGEFDPDEAYFGVPVFGMVFFATMIVLTFNNLAEGLRTVWGISRSGLAGLVALSIRSLGFFFLLQLFFIGLFLIEITLPAVFEVAIVPLQRVLLFMTLVALFTFGYGILSQHAPSFLARLSGAIVVSIMLLFMRTIVGWWVFFTPAVEQYGPAGLIFALLIWIYVTSMIIFYGAAFAWAFDHERLQGTFGQPPKRV